MISIEEVKKQVNYEADRFINEINELYSFGNLSPVLLENIRNFVLRDGKRLRPILFILSYLGFSGRPAMNFYRTSLAFELLHDFALIHDDIIDRSTRRSGRPSMHNILNEFLKQKENVRFKGTDLAIIIGDIFYAAGISSLMSIDEDLKRKEKALLGIIDAAINTGLGEFQELLYSVNDLESMKKKDIYRIYDLKTSYYTFSCPLTSGPMLVGADEQQIRGLYNYGMLMGRGFQIKDDLYDIFGSQKNNKEKLFDDIKKTKKTLLLWYAYKNAVFADREEIKRIFSKKKISIDDCLKIKQIYVKTGVPDYAIKNISLLIKKAEKEFKNIGMDEKYKEILHSYCLELVKVNESDII
jgi:geranylgeranyl diphosphate synthase type I